MNYRMIKWFDVLYYFGMRFDEFRFLLSQFSSYVKDHPHVKSDSRIAYYVLKKNYSTTFMSFMRASYMLKECL